MTQFWRNLTARLRAEGYYPRSGLARFTLWVAGLYLISELLALAIAPRVPTRDMTRRAFEQRAERAAKGQLTSAGKNTADKAHLVRGIRCGPVKRLAKRSVPLAVERW